MWESTDQLRRPRQCQMCKPAGRRVSKVLRLRGRNSVAYLDDRPHASFPRSARPSRAQESGPVRLGRPKEHLADCFKSRNISKEVLGNLWKLTDALSFLRREVLPVIELLDGLCRQSRPTDLGDYSGDLDMSAFRHPDFSCQIGHRLSNSHGAAKARGCVRASTSTSALMLPCRVCSSSVPP